MQKGKGIEKRMVWDGTPKQENVNPQRTGKHGHRVFSSFGEPEMGRYVYIFYPGKISTTFALSSRLYFMGSCLFAVWLTFSIKTRADLFYPQTPL
jgi:hypothetical protein